MLVLQETWGQCITADMSTSSYWVSENGSASDKDNVFIERVRTYSPITKSFQFRDDSGPLSPIPVGSGVQSRLWAQEQQVQQIQVTSCCAVYGDRGHRAVLYMGTGDIVLYMGTGDIVLCCIRGSVTSRCAVYGDR
ncbi:unnamed protein product [Ranitomeya imitator]|uniref:Uncharacterized protein n=1 Tax=Ranitomeya imitator TaxID=111125 RepID=A0ABN9LJW0_9NEOB|nr:unnamed protein product [Ranitomeya imitator]